MLHESFEVHLLDLISASATVPLTATAVSGVTDMLVMPQSTRNAGNSSGKSEGA